MKKEIYFGIINSVCLIIGDLMILYGNISYGLLVWALSLVFMVLVSILMPELDVKNVFQSITFLILLQMIGFSVPREFFADVVVQYILIYAIMLIPIYHIIKDRVYRGLGTDSTVFFILVLALLVGIIVELYQYIIFRDNPLNVVYINKISGEFSVLSIIITILIAMSLIGTRYCTKKVSELINMIIDSLFPVLVVTLIFNITLV